MESSVRRSFPWLHTAMGAVVLVSLAFLAAALPMADKTTFGWMVGRGFLPTIALMVIVGGLVLMVATFNLPVRRRWTGFVLFAWGLIALTSPAFGYLFLLPWSVLVLTLPLVIGILAGQFRSAR